MKPNAIRHSPSAAERQQRARARARQIFRAAWQRRAESEAPRSRLQRIMAAALELAGQPG